MTNTDLNPVSVAIPRLYVSSLPEAEQDVADVIVFWLYDMDSYHQNLIAAVELYEHCLTLMPPLTLSRWPAIPVRDGALSIYHFGMAMTLVRRKLPKCLTLNGLINTNKLREADRIFRAAFPHIKLLRHALSHAAEETPTFLNQTNPSGVVIRDCVVGNRFETTKNGLRVGYEISAQSVESINKTKTTFFEAFRPAELSLGR